MKRVLALATTALLVFAAALAPAAQAGGAEIQDPAMDHPVPFADIIAVDLEMVTVKGQSFLQVTWELSGDISAEARNLMIGYDFSAKVGKCDLRVLWYAYPQVIAPAGYPTGSAGALCGTKELGGTFKLAGKKVSVQVAMRDLKGVTAGMKMTELTAWTAPLEALNNDDTGALAMAGDHASSAKAWTLA